MHDGTWSQVTINLTAVYSKSLAFKSVTKACLRQNEPSPLPPISIRIERGHRKTARKPYSMSNLEYKYNSMDNNRRFNLYPWGFMNNMECAFSWSFLLLFLVDHTFCSLFLIVLEIDGTFLKLGWPHAPHQLASRYSKDKPPMGSMSTSKLLDAFFFRLGYYARALVFQRSFTFARLSTIRGLKHNLTGTTYWFFLLFCYRQNLGDVLIFVIVST
jgi:hypothetical protein